MVSLLVSVCIGYVLSGQSACFCLYGVCIE